VTALLPSTRRAFPLMMPAFSSGELEARFADFGLVLEQRVLVVAQVHVHVEYGLGGEGACGQQKSGEEQGLFNRGLGSGW
jgi:hypothetical protein